jgi:hypothetical protein
LNRFLASEGERTPRTGLPFSATPSVSSGMTNSRARRGVTTRDEFLRFDRAYAERHEYVGGDVCAYDGPDQLRVPEPAITDCDALEGI